MKFKRSIVSIIIVIVSAFLVWILCFPALSRVSGSSRFTCDLDNNGQAETYVLQRGHLIIREGDRLLWESPQEWSIHSCLTADADNDQGRELLLVLWKRGSFGQSKPMWIKETDNQYSNHLFLYRLAAGKLKPVWCSSALTHPIITLKVMDVNRDGKNELKVLEGPPAGPKHSLLYPFGCRSTSWVWQGWGFVRNTELN